MCLVLSVTLCLSTAAAVLHCVCVCVCVRTYMCVISILSLQCGPPHFCLCVLQDSEQSGKQLDSIIETSLLELNNARKFYQEMQAKAKKTGE